MKDKHVDSWEKPKWLNITARHVKQTKLENQIEVLQSLVMWTSGKSYMYVEVLEKLEELKKDLSQCAQ